MIAARLLPSRGVNGTPNARPGIRARFDSIRDRSAAPMLGPRGTMEIQARVKPRDQIPGAQALVTETLVPIRCLY